MVQPITFNRLPSMELFPIFFTVGKEGREQHRQYSCKKDSVKSSGPPYGGYWSSEAPDFFQVKKIFTD